MLAQNERFKFSDARHLDLNFFAVDPGIQELISSVAFGYWLVLQTWHEEVVCNEDTYELDEIPKIFQI